MKFKITCINFDYQSNLPDSNDSFRLEYQGKVYKDPDRFIESVLKPEMWEAGNAEDFIDWILSFLDNFDATRDWVIEYIEFDYFGSGKRGNPRL